MYKCCLTLNYPYPIQLLLVSFIGHYYLHNSLSNVTFILTSFRNPGMNNDVCKLGSGVCVWHNVSEVTPNARLPHWAVSLESSPCPTANSR